MAVDPPKLQFEKFSPSFATAGFGWLVDIYRAAFEHGRPDMLAFLAGNQADGTKSVEGVVEPNATFPIRFGHLEASGKGSSAELSAWYPYRLTVEIKKGEITSVDLRLFLLNPRAILAKSTFQPANVGTDGKFSPLTQAVAPIGLVILADPDADPSTRFGLLKDHVPAVAFQKTPTGYRQYAPETLLGRLDLTMKWPVEALSKVSDKFGFVLGIPGGERPKGITLIKADLFSPELQDTFNAMLRPSGGFAVCMPRIKDANLALIFDVPRKTEKNWEIYRSAVTEFGLTEDFRGLLFAGFELHWLSDGNVGHGDDYSIEVGVSALSFGGGHAANSAAPWFVSFAAGIKTLDDESYLSLFTDLRLSASLAEGDPTRFALTATFRDDLEFPYQWLADRQARLSLSLETWTDSAGAKHESKVISLELLGSSDRVLATLSPEEPVKMKPELFNSVAIALTLAPIVASTGAINTQGKGVPPNADMRGYFADIQRGSMAKLYTVATLGWFFADTVRVKEIRVVGIRLQVQPSSINGGEAGKYDTGLLFDYEADFNVAIDEADIRTSKAISTRIDGTGLVIAGPDALRWVQVPSGVRDLSLADPGLWNVGALGKILKLTEVTIRKNPRRELVLRLALSGNLGILTAGDFAFAIDLEDDKGLRLESYPSKVSVKLPSLEGSGTFVIDKSGAQEEIGGSLDLTIKSIGMRFYAGARVTKVATKTASTTTAVLATAEVEFSNMIPLASSGLGLKSISALYAMHFARIEPPAKPAVPPAMAWLKKAKGDVVKSVELPQSKELWAPTYDRWAFGIGVGLGLQISDVLVNLNSMLVLELPGPKILVFSKLNILKIPQLNKKIADKLDAGFLGLIEIDLEREEMTLAVLADVSFQKFFSFHAPIELFMGLRNLSKWHLYLGHFDNKITADLNIYDIIQMGATGCFMAAGDLIAKAPVPGGPKDLPGVALAMGVDAFVKIGGDSLYLRVDLGSKLFVSISKSLFAYGEVYVSGELRLFIVSIGASGLFKLSYLKRPGAGEDIYIEGQICGSVKICFVEISGCVSLHLGSAIVDNDPFDALIESVSVLSGTKVALRGQGATGPFDAELDKLVEGGTALGKVPLDAAISLKMPIPPYLTKKANDFTKWVTSLDQTQTKFRLGSREGQYLLHEVTLRRVVGGALVDVDYEDAKGRWWKQPQSQKGGQPVPHQLALLTRNPLGVESAVTSPADLEAWVKAITAGICDPTYEPQSCVFHWEPTQVGTGDNGLWTLPAILPNSKIVKAIGTSGATSEKVRLFMRANAGSLLDPLPGYPLYVGGCEVGQTAGGVPFGYLKLKSQYVIQELPRITSEVLFDGPISRLKPVELLIAHRLFGQEHALNFSFGDADGKEEVFGLTSMLVERLPIPAGGGQDFHEQQDYWRDHADAFVDAQNAPEFAGMTFERVRLRIDRLTISADLLWLRVGINRDVGTERPLTVLIGALKFVPIAEETRYRHDVEFKNNILSDIRDFLSRPEVPLLEPSSEYRLEAIWGTKGDGVTVNRSAEYGFCTTDEPPRDITPYLITTFPQHGEKFHYRKDTPGIVLGSNDLLRILAKFPSARLRVTITEDGGNPVPDPEGKIEWHSGHLLDPALLLDAIIHPVPGVEVVSVAALPTALEQALLELAESGGDLSCLKGIKLPEAGLWIGFKTALRPISGYVVRIDVVDVKNVANPWHYVDPSRNGDEPMLLFNFRTCLHGDLTEHVTELGKAIVGHRFVTNLPDFNALSDLSPDGVQMTADKDFEDAVAAAMGERQSQDGDVSVTLVWTGDDTAINPVGVLVRSSEPLVRMTRNAVIGKAQGQEYVAELVDADLQVLDRQRSSGVGEVVIANSGFAMFAKLGSGSGAGVTLGLKGCVLERIPRPVTKAQFKIEAGLLTSRSNRAELR